MIYSCYSFCMLRLALMAAPAVRTDVAAACCQEGDHMAEGSKHYQMGDVAAHAQAAQGENISQTMGVAGADAQALMGIFEEVFSAIDSEPSLSDDERTLARDAADEVMR